MGDWEEKAGAHDKQPLWVPSHSKPAHSKAKVFVICDFRYTKTKSKKSKKMKKNRNTQSLPQINGKKKRKTSPDTNTISTSPKILGEIESVTSIAKASETERKTSKQRGPKKLAPIKRKPKSKFRVNFRNEQLDTHQRYIYRCACGPGQVKWW